MQVIGWLCGPRLYEYAGWCFEVIQTGEPWPLRKDGELYRNIPEKFYDDIVPFLKLDYIDRESYRVGGGCEPLVRKEAEK